MHTIKFLLMALIGALLVGGVYYVINVKTMSQLQCLHNSTSISAHVVALKALHAMPLDPASDFPADTARFTLEQQEAFRQEFVRYLAPTFGKPVGWKLALSAATPDKPALGYTEPAIGQIFEHMLIKGPIVRIKRDYAVLPLYEVDLLIRVSDDLINEATTEEDIIKNIDAVIPIFELPAGFVSSFDELAGPQKNGRGLLPLLNGLARLFVLGDEIPVPGTRTVSDWIEVLQDIEGEELVVTSEEPITRQFNTLTPCVTYALRLLALLRARGHHVHKGDLLGLGFLTGVHTFVGNERVLQATYTNLSPHGPVSVKVSIDNENGLCFG